MEDTLRVSRAFSSQRATPVLILVLMEDTLRVLKVEDAKRVFAKVLILVLMEDTLREWLCLHLVMIFTS